MIEENTNLKRLPAWLKKPPASASETRQLKKLLRKSSLNTVCEEARCPNISECFSRGTATFMILGDVCTRGCRFCSVITGKPHFPEVEFDTEAINVAEAAKSLNLKHVVLTSVARDDLADGGASGFVASIKELRKTIDKVSIEVLIPDLRGDFAALEKIIEAKPDVLNHNLETVPRLYRKVRPGASYQRSLKLLHYVKKVEPKISTKTGIMLGLGETKNEVLALFDDAKSHDIDIFTAGQYMQPTREHLAVEKYLSPEEFEDYESLASKIGFAHVFIGPLVRSSYHADEFISTNT